MGNKLSVDKRRLSKDRDCKALQIREKERAGQGYKLSIKAGSNQNQNQSIPEMSGRPPTHFENSPSLSSQLQKNETELLTASLFDIVP